jgi:hypothetical protein
MTVDSGVAGAPVHAGRALGPHYKWVALSNTTLGMLMATINQSIVLIALPDVFHGIGLKARSWLICPGADCPLSRVRDQWSPAAQPATPTMCSTSTRAKGWSWYCG